MMASVLGILRNDPLLAEQPKLAAYLARCDARPAYRRALAAHLADLRD
jgi:glutathione S-transferase